MKNEIVIECDNVGGIEEILQAHAIKEARCKTRTAATAKALIESGVANSEREAADIIASDTGEKPETVRKRIARGKTVGTGVPKKNSGLSATQDSAKSDILTLLEDSLGGINRDDRLVWVLNVYLFLVGHATSELCEVCQLINDRYARNRTND